MTKSTDRRKFLAIGGAALMTGLAGCAAFRDRQDVPGDTEPPDEPANDRHPVNPIGFPDGDDPEDVDDNDENDENDDNDEEVAENDDNDENGE